MAADLKTLLEVIARLEAKVDVLSVEVSSKTKAKKEKRATTNVEGPAAWNLFVKETQKTLASAAGVDVSSMDEAAFKKAAAAKDSGFGWQVALKEASRRKAVLEGRDPDAPKPAKKTAAAGAPAAPAAPKAAPKSKAKDAAAAALAKAAADFEELNMGELEIDGKSYYVQQDTLEVYEIASQWVMGDRLGVYDVEAESIDVFA